MQHATCDMQAAGSPSLLVHPTIIFEQSGLALVGVKIVQQSSTIFGV